MARPKNIGISTIKRNQRFKGPASSEQQNDFQAEIVNDFATIQEQWNSTIVPLTRTLPDGTQDKSIDAFLNGLDGQTIYTHKGAVSTGATGRYFNITSNRPTTIYEQFIHSYTYIDEQISSVQSSISNIGSSSSGITDEQKDRIGSNIFDSTSTSSDSSLDGQVTGLRTDVDTLDSSVTSLSSSLSGKQNTSEKGQANGYASLNGSAVVPPAQLGSGTSISTKFLRGDNTWQTVSGGGGGGSIDGSIAANQVAVGDGTDSIAGSSSLTWDGTKFAIGVASPTVSLHTVGMLYAGVASGATTSSGASIHALVNNLNGAGTLHIQNSNASGVSTIQFADNGGTFRGSVGHSNGVSLSGHDNIMHLYSAAGTDLGIFAHTNLRILVDAGTTTFYANATSDSAGPAAITAINTGTGLTFTRMATLTAPNISNNTSVTFVLGKAQSTENSVYIAHHHISDGSTSNRFDVGFFGSGEKFTILASGATGIGTLAPRSRLEVYEGGSSAGTWKGRIIAGGITKAFLMGEYNGKAWLGAHNTALSAWEDLEINPDGAKQVRIGTVSTEGSAPLLILDNGTTVSTFAKSVTINDSGASLIGLTVKGSSSTTGTDEEIGSLRVEKPTDSTYNLVADFYAPNITSGHEALLGIGKDQLALYNSGNIGFHHIADGSLSNYLTFNLYGSNNLLQLNAAGQTKVKGLAHATRTVTADTTIVASDYTIRVDATSGVLTVTLPTATSATGQVFIIKKIDNANNVVVEGAGSEVIDGASNKTLTTQYEFVRVQSNGTSWDII